MDFVYLSVLMLKMDDREQFVDEGNSLAMGDDEEANFSEQVRDIGAGRWR